MMAHTGPVLCPAGLHVAESWRCRESTSRGRLPPASRCMGSSWNPMYLSPLRNLLCCLSRLRLRALPPSSAIDMDAV